MKQKTADRRIMIGGMSIFFINGMMVLITSSILIYLIDVYNLTYEQGGLLISTQAFFYLLTNLISGPIAARIGRKKTLLLVAACFMIGFGGLSLTPPFFLLYICLAVTGLGWGASNNMVNFLITEVTHGDSGKITLIHTCYSLGAFLGPLMVGLAVQRGQDWRLPVALVAVGALLLWPIILAMPIHEPERIKKADKPASNLSFLKQWRFYMFMLMLFIYVGIEIGFSGWLITYLSVWRHFSEASAQTMLSLLWVFMIIGRLAVSLAGKNIRKAPFLLLEATGMVLAGSLLIVSRHPLLLGFAVCLLGLSFSAFYGMVVANASYLVMISSLASGLMFSMGGLGASILPYMAGFFTERNGITAGLWFLVISAVFLVALTALNVWDSRRRTL